MSALEIAQIVTGICNNTGIKCVSKYTVVKKMYEQWMNLKKSVCDV